MVDRTPIFVEVDGLDRPTGLAEFVSGTDVISQEVGGTGASSVSGVVIGLGSSILIDELASGVSGAAQQATGLIFNPTTGAITPEVGMTDIDITGKEFITTNLTVKATDFTVNGTQCPIPLPFAYMQMDSDGTSTNASALVGAGATVSNITSDSDDITWNDTQKQFHVSAAGTYECLGTITFEGGATLVLITINKNDVPVLSVTPRVHSTVDPVERTVRAIFTAAAGNYINIAHDSQSSNTVKPITGSTISLKRLK